MILLEHTCHFKCSSLLVRVIVLLQVNLVETFIEGQLSHPPFLGSHTMLEQQ